MYIYIYAIIYLYKLTAQHYLLFSGGVA